MEWLYLQVFFGRSAELGRDILLDCLAPQTQNLLAAGQIAKFFYLYYSEGGNHIRLRLTGAGDALSHHARPALEAALHAYKARITDQDAMPDEGFPLWQYATYEPEYYKFGGERGMPIAESHFQTSSEAAIVVQTAVRQQRLTAQQAVIILVEELVKNMGYRTPATRLALYSGCRDYWLQTILAGERETWLAYYKQRSAQIGDSIAHMLQKTAYPKALAGLLPWWRRKAAENHNQLTSHVAPQHHPLIVQNYIHLLHNRAGLSIAQEAFLLHVLAEAQRKQIDLEENYATHAIFYKQRTLPAC